MLHYEESIKKLLRLIESMKVLEKKIHQDHCNIDPLDFRAHDYYRNLKDVLMGIFDLKNIILQDIKDVEEGKNLQMIVKFRQCDYLKIKKVLDEINCTWSLEKI